MYIYREILGKIESVIRSNRPRGLILSGIVGCGKTTVVSKVLEHLSDQFKIFSFTGDDSQFRQKIIQDTKYLFSEIRSQTQERALVFVDEVQKCDEVFDSLKYAFDKGEISFIVSGSNPEYLSTVAKKRLQRRADQLIMLPISLAELSVHNGWMKQNDFLDLWNLPSFASFSLPSVSYSDEILKLTDKYFIYGGLPLSLLSDTEEEKMREIRLTVERGFELMSVQNNSVAELIKAELAELHSSEFTYQNIMHKTRLRKRDIINETIDQLINHGYLAKKKPMLFESGKASYLSIFSYIDSGIVSYLTGNTKVSDSERGDLVEGYIHARIHCQVYNSVFKPEYGYFKPHTLDTNGNLRYLPGKIDFILKKGKELIPVEVKSEKNFNNINTSLIEEFIKDKKIPFGIVLYGGVPYKDMDKKILFWPYWMF